MDKYFKEMPLMYKLINAFGLGIVFGGMIGGTIMGIAIHNKAMNALSNQSELYEKQYDSLVEKIKEKGFTIKYGEE